jgi:hypothetical protein
LNTVFLNIWLSHKAKYQLTQAQSGLRLLPQFLGAFSQGQMPTHTGKVPLLALTTTHRVGENIYQQHIRQRTDNQNIQGAQKTKLPKINEQIKNWETELNRTFSKEEIQMAKKTHEKMLTIPGYKGNANQTH